MTQIDLHRSRPEAAPALASWAEFERSSPDMAAAARRLFDRDGVDQAFLATVRGDEAPRIHPVYVGIVEGVLCSFLSASAKKTDLEHDGRFALHTFQDSATIDEFSVRGRARRVTEPALIEAAAAAWPFATDGAYELFAFSIERALLGRRDSADDWPPRYTSWQADR